MDIKVNPSEYVWKITPVGEDVQLLSVTDPTNGKTIINLVLPHTLLLGPALKKFVLNTWICGYMSGHKDGATEKVTQIRNALGL